MNINGESGQENVTILLPTYKIVTNEKANLITKPHAL